MSKFYEDLEVGAIIARDRWQFELKSEFFPRPKRAKSKYTQEFYLFIPNSLQINEDTYPKKQFYRDQTNLIRFKTPEFTLKELYNPENKQSPLTKLTKSTELKQTSIEDELKLLGNITRSSLREGTRSIIDNITKDDEVDVLRKIDSFCNEIIELRSHYFAIQMSYLKDCTDQKIKTSFLYTDEFINNSINFYLSGLFDFIDKKNYTNLDQINLSICKVLSFENKHHLQIEKSPQDTLETEESSEYTLYRKSLLKKYMMDALMLNTNRLSVVKRFRILVGSMSAGLAMFFFFLLFVKQGQVFLINSTPFILATVVLYILKDQMKEGLRNLSYQQFAKWFYDYKTDILSPDEQTKLGVLQESMTFVSEGDLPKEITQMRNKDFHAILETYKRAERIIYYKKNISIHSQENNLHTRRFALNLIFRFNIAHFLTKADNPKYSYLKLDPKTCKLLRSRLPKVYHLNIILKNCYLNLEGKYEVSFEKFRLILDKNGIKRVEHLKK